MATLIKNKNRAVFAMTALTAILSFLPLNLMTVSGQDTEAVQPDEIAKQYVMPLLRAMQKGDKDGMYLNWIDSKHSKKTDAAFDQLINLWDGRVAISVKRTGEKKTPIVGPLVSVYPADVWGDCIIYRRRFIRGNLYLYFSISKDLGLPRAGNEDIFFIADWSYSLLHEI